MTNDYESLRKTVIYEEIDDINISKDLFNISYALKHSQGEDVSIAVLDTGLSNHKDMSGKVLYAYNTLNRTEGNVEDFNGHGTHVAGLLVGDKTGVSPLSKLVVVKSLNDEGVGSITSVMDGINLCMQLNVDIMCLSLTMERIPLLLEQKILDAYNKGIIIVSAVGNEGRYEPSFPAKLNTVVGVGGINENGRESDFSNRGADFLAPSISIISTYTQDDKYVSLTGTSQSTPLIAGLFALAISYAKANKIYLSNVDMINIFKENSVFKIVNMENVFKQIKSLTKPLNNDII